MPANFAEIEEALDDIAVEVRHLAARLDRLDSGEHLQPSSQEEWEASIVCASATEKVYTGCERIMERLAKDVDGERVLHEANWHRDLLDRMRSPSALRGPIITAETFALLDRMRAFRHRERNSYGHGLRFDIVVGRAREMILGFSAFAADVRRFRDSEGPGKEHSDRDA